MAYKYMGRWRGEVRVLGVRKTKLFDKKKDAIDWEIQTTKRIEDAAKAEQAEQLLDPDNLLIGPVYEEYLDDVVLRSMSEKTYKEKRSVGQKFIKSLGGPHFQLIKLKRMHIRRFMRDQIKPAQQSAETSKEKKRKNGSSSGNKEVKPRTGNAVNKDLKNLLAFWNWFRNRYELELHNPFEVDKLPEVSHPRYVPPFADFQKVINQADDGQGRILLHTYFLTAARRGEILKLRWSEVDFDLMQIGLWTKKRSNGNYELDWQAMSLNLADELKKQRLLTGLGEYVFVNPRKGRGFLDRRNWLNKLCDAAGVKRFGYHGIRHLSAHIAILTESMTLPDIQHLLRHKSILTTQRYVDKVRKGAKASQVLGDYLKSATWHCHTAVNEG